MTEIQATAVARESAEYAKFEQLLDRYYAAWSWEGSVPNASDFDGAGQFYAKEPDLIFYDPLPPVEGHRGWQGIKTGVAQVWGDAGIISANITPCGELQVWRRGNLALSISFPTASAKLRNGQAQEIEQRHTIVWQQRDGKWLIVHEHASASVSLGSNLQQRGGTTSGGDDVGEFSQLVREFWSAWNTRNYETAARFYAKTPELVVFLPWRKEGFTGWDAFKQFANEVMQNMQIVQFTPYEDVHVFQFDDIAVAAGTFGVMMRDKSGTTTQGDARYTLIWEKHNGDWLIVHEHLSSTVS